MGALVVVMVVVMVAVMVVVMVVVVLVVLHRNGSALALDISMFRGLLRSRAVGRPSTLCALGCSLHCKRWGDPATQCGWPRLHVVKMMAVRACGVEYLPVCWSCCCGVFVLGLLAKVLR